MVVGVFVRVWTVAVIAGIDGVDLCKILPIILMFIESITIPILSIITLRTGFVFL